MTQRYVALARPPKLWRTEDGEFWAERPTLTVWESDPAPIDTGLLDASGTRLYRTPDRQPMGFRTGPRE